MDSLTVKLDRIRAQSSSKLDNQKNHALILSAVDDNLKDQSNSQSATAYFVSFLALLNQSFADDEISDTSLATSAAYFLDMVLPFVPKPLLKAKFAEILVRLAPAITSSESSAALIRSCIGGLESILIAQDAKSWNSKLNVSPWRAFQALLDLALDPRPKIRKRAQEAIHNVLSNPPPSPSLGHIAGPQCCEFALKSVVTVLKSGKKINSENNALLIHNLQLIQAITSAGAWSSTQVEPLCDVLLEISKTSDQYLVVAALDVFEKMFDALSSEIYTDKLLNISQILFDLKPALNDHHLVGPWVAVVAKAVESYSKIDSYKCFVKLPSYFLTLAEYLSSEVNAVYSSAASGIISVISTCIPDSLLLMPGSEVTVQQFEDVEEVLESFGEMVKNLLGVKYIHCASKVLEILTCFLNKLRFRANPSFLEAFTIVGQWRTEEESVSTLDLKSEEEASISAAISSFGGEVVLEHLPLNLEHPTNSRPGRAWLLPLLRDNVRFSSLKFYIDNVLPLASVFEKKIQSLDKSSVHAKVFQTVSDQIWSLLPPFCDLPNDLKDCFDVQLAEQLSNTLFDRPDLRTTICHGLKLVVESNLIYSKGVLDDDILLSQRFPVEIAKSNLAYLSENISENMFKVLSLVLSKTNPDSRGYILDTIDIWLQVMPETVMETSFNQVAEMLHNSLEEEAKSGKFDTAKNTPKPNSTPRISIAMMDLIVAMTKYLSSSCHNSLLAIFNRTVTVQDSSVQKRSYRIVSKLAETEEGKQALSGFISDIETVMINAGSSALGPAKTTRLFALKSVLDLLPLSDLYFIPSIASELILATKDVNEKTRETAYEMLIQMGKLMSTENGIIDNSKVPGMPEDAGQTAASITEYFTIVSAGLASSSPHMISATVTTLSCLIYEYFQSLPEEFMSEICETVDLFLTSNNREIVKSAIGFVKVQILSLPVESVQAKLPELLQHLMKWSHEHKGHFKLKVRHILERMIRRFGYEIVEKSIPEEDIKLLVNIKKTKQRNKRKAAVEETTDSKESTQSKAKRFASAYDEVLYDSDEDEDENSGGEEENNTGKSKQYIIEDRDSPLDLLDKNALTHISSSNPAAKARKSMASKFKSKNGKFVFNEKGELEDEENILKKDNAINAYLDAVKQGPVRGQKNRLKYKRGKTNVGDAGSDSDDEKPKHKIKSGRIGKGDKKNRGFKSKRR